MNRLTQISRTTPAAYVAAAGCICLLSLIALFGCSAVPVTKPVRYYLELPQAEAADKAEKKNARIAVEPVRGRAPYHRKAMLVSPSPHVMEAYHTAQWAESPCDMLTDMIIGHLGRRFSYVTRMPRRYGDGVSWIVVVYLDALDQVHRNAEWSAVMRLKYDIVSDEGRKIVESGWFERKKPLAGADPKSYVAAQDQSVVEFLAHLAEMLDTLSATP